ncbi:hypothetical protein ACFL3V_03780 [Nanoarchaeota archaeon]
MTNDIEKLQEDVLKVKERVKKAYTALCNLKAEMEQMHREKEMDEHTFDTLNQHRNEAELQLREVVHLLKTEDAELDELDKIANKIWESMGLMAGK